MKNQLQKTRTSGILFSKSFCCWSKLCSFANQTKFNSFFVETSIQNLYLIVENIHIICLLSVRISYEPETGKCQLLIVEVFPQDAGEYRCIAVNEKGKAVSRATLEVECKSQRVFIQTLNSLFILNIWYTFAFQFMLAHSKFGGGQYQFYIICLQ